MLRAELDGLYLFDLSAGRFTDAVIEAVNAKPEPVVVILWIPPAAVTGEGTRSGSWGPAPWLRPVPAGSCCGRGSS